MGEQLFRVGENNCFDFPSLADGCDRSAQVPLDAAYKHMRVAGGWNRLWDGVCTLCVRSERTKVSFLNHGTVILLSFSILCSFVVDALWSDAKRLSALWSLIKSDRMDCVFFLLDYKAFGSNILKWIWIVMFSFYVVSLPLVSFQSFCSVCSFLFKLFSFFLSFPSFSLLWASILLWLVF